MPRFLIILLLVAFAGCQKELSYVGGLDPVAVLPSPITAHIQGNIFDETGAPAVGASVKVGTQSTITDAKGYFRIRNAALDKFTSLVTVEKSGYFKAFRTFSATPAVNHVEIKLIKKTLAGTVDAATGGEVSLSNGSKVKLNPNSIVTGSNGASYTGQVQVYAAYIDPTAPDFGQTVPGSLMANDADGKRVILESYGMMAVELETSTGTKLQIKIGSTALLTTAIPSSIASTAPGSIKTWSVDEATGLWKQETTATKNGNVYVGEVSHFSFWNCDVPLQWAHISLQLKDASGEPITSAWVKVMRANNDAASGWTDSTGVVAGIVPANEPLVLSVIDQCYNPIYTQNIGPFSSSTNLGVITVTSPLSSMITVKGKLLNCSGNPVTSGYAIIYFGNYTQYAGVDNLGNFSKVFITCASMPTTISATGIDAQANQQNTSVSVANVTFPITNFNNITACGTSTVQFINYTLDGTAFAISNTTPGDSLSVWNASQGSVNLLFSGFKMSNQNTFINYGVQNVTGVGTYPVTQVGANGNYSSNLLLPFNLNLTSNASAQGQYYEGTFSGQFQDSTNVTHSLNGAFRVRRYF